MVVLEAKVRLVDKTAASSLVVLGYQGMYEAGDHVPEIMQYKPIALEGMDDRLGLVVDMKAIHLHPENVELLPKGGGWLLVEFVGTRKADAQARRMLAALKQSERPLTMKLYDDPPVEQRIWKVRESGLGATAHVPN